MRPARPSIWIDIVHAARGYDGNLGMAMIGASLGLVLMMAIGMLVPWQVG